MKKKLLAGLLLATLVIGTLSPTSSEAAAKKATKTKTKTQTKIDGVAIKDLIAGKYNDIRTVKTKVEESRIHYSGSKKEKKQIFFTDYAVKEETYDYDIDELYHKTIYPIQKRAYGKAYKGKPVAFGDGPTDVYTDEDAGAYRNSEFPHLRYNDANFVKASETLYGLWDIEYPLGSREEEVAKWKLDPSCFKTTKAKLTDDEIIIKGTYTFSVKKIRGKVHLYSENKCIEGYNFDRGFFDYIRFIRGGGDEYKIYKDVKCDATAVFYRDTKQLKSLELKAKLPKKGYYLDQFESEAIGLYNASYTFKHRLTEAQKAERVSKITEEEMIEGKANDFKVIEYEFKSNYDYDRYYPGCSPIYFNKTVKDVDIPGFYINSAYSVGDKQFSTGFDLSRFNITSSETKEDVITITGVYTIKTDSNTIYDNYVEYLLYYYTKLYGDYNDMTTDVTIVFNSKTKAMEKVTLKYNFDNIILTNTWDEVFDSEGLECYTIYTFNNNNY